MNPAVRQIPPDADDCAANRVNFLTGGAAAADRVRPAILASWYRSRERGLAADRVEVPYLRDPDIDTPLTRTSAPVLARLSEKLAGQSVSIILTDPSGLVLSRRTLDAAFERKLDRVLLAPGFSYAERFAGTNGIGTALESGSATQVFGHEHYAENLEMLACAAAPINDPVTGRLLGVLDLTCRRKDTDSLLLTLAETTAEQIQQALLITSGQAELQLLHAYRQTCLRTSGPVLALTGDMLTVNDRTRAELDPADQAAVLAHAAEIGRRLAPGRRRSELISLPTGGTARVYCQQVIAGSACAGLVVHVRPVDVTPERGTGHRAHPDASRPVLPGLIGNAPPWRRACAQAEAVLLEGSWLALVGEPGVGKLALLRSLARRHRPTARLTVLDAHDARRHRGWAGEARRALGNWDAVIIAHVESLSGPALRALSAALGAASRRPTPIWVAVTLQPDPTTEDLHELLVRFARPIDVPPLRVRLDDVTALVTHFLGGAGQLTCSTEAMRTLMRSSWPGNVGELRRLIEQLRQHHHTGTIGASDLPSQLPAISRRILTPIESIERDAIVEGLADANGNKVQAARALGISRATIYRRIREYGIVVG